MLQECILDPFLFLIHINDLHNDLIPNVKFFADDTSVFFSVVNDINVSTEEINNNLKRISEWTYQWKMMFNPDLTKQAQVIFSRKTVKSFHPQVFFNEVPVEYSVSRKHLDLYQKLDLVNTLTKKSLKHKKEYQSLKNFIIYCQEMYF